MLPSWLFALLVLLRERWSARRDAQIRFLTLQIEMLRTRLPGNRVVLSPTERRRLLKIGTELNHDVHHTIRIVTFKTYKRWQVLPSSIVGDSCRSLERGPRRPLIFEYHEHNEYLTASLQREYLSERQRLVGEPSLHSRGLVHGAELQGHVSSDEVIVTTEKFQLLAQSIATSGMSRGSPMQVGAALPEGQVMAFHEGGVQRVGVFRP